MMNITFIKKRDGSMQEFNPEKIQNAISKAFLASRVSFDTEVLKKITDIAIQNLQTIEETPSVEQIQNIVEKVLMENHFYTVAKSYIIYRYEHTKTREVEKKEVIKKIETDSLIIIKKSGEKQAFSIEKLKKYIESCVEDKSQIDVAGIANQCRSEIYDGITTSEISKAVILCARSYIERDPAYSKLASKMLLKDIYKEVLGDNFDFTNLKIAHTKSFKENLMEGVKIERLNPKILLFDTDFLGSHIELSRDENLDYLGMQTLYDRYFLRNPETKAVLETPQMFWMRVAMGLALNETNYNEKAVEFYNVMSQLLFVPSTPTLFHAGTNHPQLSSCYITTVEDSLNHIFKSISDNAQMSKWSGGIGNDWSSLRGMGSLIKGTGVESQGVVPFLKIANDTTVAINRSGRRRGATCAYLEAWHLDFEDFLELRKNTGDERRRTHDMNTASWIPDLFMKRVRGDMEWTLFSPNETPELHEIYGKEFELVYEKYEQKVKNGEIKLYKTIKASDLWKKIISMLFETGHPWITFKDPCNVRSPQDHAGVIHSSNLCTEITLNTSKDETAVCNLGSVNFARHTENGFLDKVLLEKTVKTAMRMLDNVVDLNFYPTIEGETSNKKHRPIGLGIMGYQDALYNLNIPFDSEENIEFADESMELVSYFAISTSVNLAKEKGAYSSFRGSKWDRGIMPVDTIALLEEARGEKINVNRETRLDWNKVRELIKENGMRNSNCMAIAPTATISNIAGCSPTIEPIYKNIYVKSNMSGEFTIVNSYLVNELKKINLWNSEMLSELKRYDGSVANIDAIPMEIRAKYKEVFEVDSDWLTKSAAYRGKWIDQSQSVNMFIKGTSGKKISDTYQFAWEMGLKTTYYLRSLAATHVEKSTLDIKKQDLTKSEINERPIEQPSELTVEPKLCKIEDPDCESCQ
ncbi:MAG: ribonucleoside-diphosphate reductase subunit alpha [Candidatus Magasanikbacteria bacterium CG_4_9_14_3_um_filter_32_9]|uniref:Ribonucleoside-diphosphate reductase n=1 Tax=Candidatus Magasanikbacteria bacterium CG_4_9_14_3_um_filter_32_9 TaxID=1974644 RepID=A0A2M7Z6K8_9BACT|nr:MAG: ribonucleoside-diphosphate reductase subunit alpha [Candidatus Magasanikbacteria bacterium CG_4_9_14_3_um_filter_32_9]